MAVEPKEPPWKAAWKWITEAFNLWTILAATGIGGLVATVIPLAYWKTAIPWLWVVFAMSATVAGSRIARSLYARFDYRRHPPFLAFEIDQGGKGSLTLHHTGAATEYSATGKVLRTVDGSMNPVPQLFECELLLRGKGSSPIVTMQDGDFMQIVLASVLTNKISERTFLAVRRGKFGNDYEVPASGVEIEIRVKANPSPAVPIIARQ